MHNDHGASKACFIGQVKKITLIIAETTVFIVQTNTIFSAYSTSKVTFYTIMPYNGAMKIISKNKKHILGYCNSVCSIIINKYKY